MWFKILLSSILLLSIAGCATMQKKTSVKEEMRKLQNRVSELEGELRQRDEEAYSLEKRLTEAQKSQTQKSTAAKKTTTNIMTPKNIQIALKNADLYSGPIDGKIGKNTKKAIKEFQRRKGLTPDGIVGEKTGAKLGEFLY